MRFQPIFTVLMAPLLALPSLAKPAPYHGNFIICSNDEDTLKMTADLSDGKGEKVATAVSNGVKLVFPETLGGKFRYGFRFYPNRNTPLIATPQGGHDPEILLTLAPGEGEPEMIYDQKTPLIYQMSRFKAILSLKTFKVKERPVTCTLSKWESD